MPAWNPQRVDFPTWIRQGTLRRHPICQVCNVRAATQVDHIKGVTACIKAGINPNTTANAQSICAECHERKTAQERLAGQRALADKRLHPGSRKPH